MIGCTTDILREIHTFNLVHDPYVIQLIQADISYERLLSPLRLQHMQNVHPVHPVQGIQGIPCTEEGISNTEPS